MKPQNIFSLTVYKRTIWLQVVLDILAMIGLIGAIFLMLRYDEAKTTYIWAAIIFYTLMRMIYVIIIFVQILFFKQFKLLISFVFVASFVVLLVYENLMAIPAISVGEPSIKREKNIIR